MGQRTEKMGKLSLTTACVMDGSRKVPLKDTARLRRAAAADLMVLKRDPSDLFNASETASVALTACMTRLSVFKDLV